MYFPHLFQFLGAKFTPPSIRRTMLEQFAWCQQRLSSFYNRTADAAVEIAAANGFSTIVELGAGGAPITQHLVLRDDCVHLRCVVCDLIPDVDHYRSLESAYAPRVSAICEPVDIETGRDWGSSALLVLSAAFHHLPSRRRLSIMRELCESSGGVLITAPMNRSLTSLGQTLLGPLLALLLPVLCRQQPGSLRRALWCWLIPVAPLLILWDGIVGWTRQWTDAEWRTALRDACDLAGVRVFESSPQWQLAACVSSDAAPTNEEQSQPPPAVCLGEPA